jgi:hypothetical protein
MRRLRFVGLTDDGAHLVTQVEGGGDCFLLPIDDRVRAALRGERTQGQVTLSLDAPLRPKDIQARIRAGQSPEQVAAESGQSVERVMRFAYPVLAERGRVVAEARRATVRREAAAPTLGEVVDRRLSARGVDPDSVSWDSWRRDDGTWMVMARWRSADADRCATWMFDLAGKIPAAEDDMAMHLSAEDDRPFAGRLTPVTPLAAAAHAAANGENATEPIPSLAELAPGRGKAGSLPKPTRPDRDADGDGRRARVPSWDEILLGGPRRVRE